MEAKIKHNILGNSQPRHCNRKSHFTRQYVFLNAAMIMWIRKIHSSTRLNFYLDSQNDSESVHHERKMK